MNRALVDRIAKALLYEGYLLYPYRPSVKNRHRWTFGGLYPPLYTAAGSGSDASVMQTQCLVRGSGHTRLSVTVRFLQLSARKVGEFESPLGRWPEGEDVEADQLPPYRHVESLRVADVLVHTWQEAIEREVALGENSLGDLAACPRWAEFSFAAGRRFEPVRVGSGEIVGLIEREQRRIDGGADVAAEPVGDGLYRATVRIENRTRMVHAAAADRELALLQSLVSTHTLLGVQHGEFISLLDPPEPLSGPASECSNVGTWPVLVGAEGEADTLLSSPIVLYDYPQVAPESPGDLFDSTEIDEILSLRIMTLTDDEKREVAALDHRGKAILERTEALARQQLLDLHGTFRELRPVAGKGGSSHE